MIEHIFAQVADIKYHRYIKIGPTMPMIGPPWVEDTKNLTHRPKCFGDHAPWATITDTFDKVTMKLLEIPHSFELWKGTKQKIVKVPKGMPGDILSLLQEKINIVLSTHIAALQRIVPAHLYGQNDSTEDLMARRLAAFKVYYRDHGPIFFNMSPAKCHCHPIDQAHNAAAKDILTLYHW
jgi:hypothetical protein